MRLKIMNNAIKNNNYGVVKIKIIGLHKMWLKIINNLLLKQINSE